MIGLSMVMTLFSAMISGMITSTLLFIAGMWQKKLQGKREVVSNLFAYRYQYLNCENSDETKFMEEISRIPIVFNDDRKSLESLERFYEKTNYAKTLDMEIRKEEFVILMKQLCTSAHYNCKNWNDSRFVRSI